jgi:hypothetical protein
MFDFYHGPRLVEPLILLFFSVLFFHFILMQLLQSPPLCLA